MREEGGKEKGVVVREDERNEREGEQRCEKAGGKVENSERQREVKTVDRWKEKRADGVG